METSSTSDRSYARKSLPPGLPTIGGWPEWVPSLSTHEHPDMLVSESLSALAWANPKSVNLIRLQDVSILNHFPWKGLDLWIREVFGQHLSVLPTDEGYLMRAHVACLYPGASSRGLWERLMDEPAQIMVRSTLQESVRLLLFYASVFASYGVHAELVRLQPTLDLCRRGFLPLGLDADRRAYIITG